VTKTKAKTTKTKAPKRSKAAIPEFKNLEEEAKYWDTHSLADHWGEFKPVKVTFAANLSEGITVRFDSATLNRLRTEAESKRIGTTSLIRMWIMERLASEGKATAAR
jgi:hypothetical protein